MVPLLLPQNVPVSELVSTNYCSYLNGLVYWSACDRLLR